MNFRRGKSLFIFTISLELILSAGTTSVSSKGTVSGRKNEASVTGATDFESIASLERPPVLTPLEKKSGRYDDAGVTLPPVKRKNRILTKKLDNISKPLNKLDFHGSLRRFKSAFSRISNVLRGKNSNGEGRYMDGWMEGAMVPMTFLLMAAFIMDILQRLFPLPYATFVAQHGGRSPVALVATTAKPIDLTKVQFNTALGNFGFETNENDGFNLFGRSNQGNPEFVDTTSYQSTSGGQIANQYLNDVQAVNQSGPIISNLQTPENVHSDVPSSYGIPIIPGSGWGYPEYLPGPGPIPGITDYGTYNPGVHNGSNSGGMNNQGGYGKNQQGGMNNQGGYGNNNNSGGTNAVTGGYGSVPVQMNNDPLGGASEISEIYNHVFESSKGLEPYEDPLPSNLVSTVADINDIPLVDLELLKYYAQFEEGKALWSRSRRSTSAG